MVGQLGLDSYFELSTSMGDLVPQAAQLAHHLL